ncbi:coenzyme F420-0:L-glutamate ligase [Candidatus Pacebacteria bacterium]|nr:coenzyme F420-0:L-glutamate ligase [Candidatus Paceibacterota bacterium]
MIVTPIKTRSFIPPQDDVFAVFDAIDLDLQECSVIAVTAKIVAIHQGRCIPIPPDEKKAALQKDELIKTEADKYLERDLSVPFPRMFTMYEGTFCSSCGIDESNSNGYWTLLPKDSSVFASELRLRLRDRYNIKSLGVIVVDSRSFPMRNGTIGMTIGYTGFKAQYDYRGESDLFDRPFKAERINVADCLASTAILAMGEGAESTPVAIISDVSHIEFVDHDDSKDFMLSLKVPMEKDVFAQFYTNKNWKKEEG